MCALMRPFKCRYKLNVYHVMESWRKLRFSRNTEQDAREAMRVVFSVLTKRICMHKTYFLRIYSNIVLKVILICKLQLS